jgi:hypothetical protein
LKHIIPLVSLIALALVVGACPALGVYQDTETVTIHVDGSVTPLSAPVSRSGEVYTLTDDIYIYRSTNFGIEIQRGGVTLDGAGHKIKGNGQSSAIFLEKLESVIIRNVMLDNFYWGIELRDCTKCTIYRCNLTAVMYPLYLYESSNNLIYNNNIYRIPYYHASDNKWDNGYPTGGNYYDGYPYPDVKKGPNQDQPGSDGIGDVKVGEEIFSAGGANVDNYPLYKAKTFVNESGGGTQTSGKSTITITLVDSKNSPIVGATVSSTSQPSGQAPLSATTDNNGAASFTDVLPGSYSFSVQKTGFTSSTISVDSAADEVKQQKVNLVATPSTAEITLVVKDDKGAAVSGAAITSTVQPNGQAALSGTTGANGEITFSGVLEGSYTFKVTKTSFDTFTVVVEATHGGVVTTPVTIKAQQASGGGVPGYPLEATLLGVAFILFIIGRARILKVEAGKRGM